MKFKDISDDMTLTEVHDEFCQLLQSEETNHHRMGLLYNHVVKKKLAQKAKYKNALDYFGKNIKQVSRSALLMYSSVAKTFSAEVTGELGVTRLNLLLIYKEAADISVNTEAPADTSIEVPADDGSVITKPFGECTVDELRQAIQRKRKPTSSKPLPPEVMAKVEEYRDAVIAAFPEDAPVRVDARNHKGVALISFKDIPMAQLDSLIELLTDLSEDVPVLPLVATAQQVTTAPAVA